MQYFQELETSFSLFFNFSGIIENSGGDESQKRSASRSAHGEIVRKIVGKGIVVGYPDVLLGNWCTILKYSNHLKCRHCTMLFYCVCLV